MTITETKTIYVITWRGCYYKGDLDLDPMTIKNAELWTTKPEQATQMSRNLARSLEEWLSTPLDVIQAKKMTITTVITVENLEDD